MPTLHALQKVAFINSWYMPTAHGLQLLTFSEDENLPGSHAVHTRPLTHVPGEHEPQYPSVAPPQLLRKAPLMHWSVEHFVQLGAFVELEKLG
jgi:hypothetical protein